MNVRSKHGMLVGLLVAGMLLTHVAPCAAAVGAVRIEGTDRYETSAKTAYAAY